MESPVWEGVQFSAPMIPVQRVSTNHGPGALSGWDWPRLGKTGTFL